MTAKPTARELRVARAINKRGQDFRWDGRQRDMACEQRWRFEELNPAKRQAYIAVARAAIKAMRSK